MGGDFSLQGSQCKSVKASHSHVMVYHLSISSSHNTLHKPSNFPYIPYPFYPIRKKEITYWE